LHNLHHKLLLAGTSPLAVAWRHTNKKNKKTWLNGLPLIFRGMPVINLPACYLLPVIYFTLFTHVAFIFLRQGRGILLGGVADTVCESKLKIKTGFGRAGTN